jgi:hypothetical protein
MSDYTQITSFGPKDALATGNPSKLIKGTEFDAEFDAIATAIATKFDSGSVASQAVAEALASSTTLITPQRLKQALEAGVYQFNINGLTEEASAAAVGDFVPVYDVSAGAVRKFTLTNLVASTGFVPNGRILTSGSGLTGGGDLSADRTLAVGQGLGVTVNADDVQVDAGAGLTFSGNALIVGQGSGISVTADAVAVDRTNATTTDATGYMDLPVNEQSGNYTLVAGDRGKLILHPSGAGAGDTFTIPANASVAYPIGTVICFANRANEDLTIAITSDAMVLEGTISTGSRTLALNGFASAKKITSTIWFISGSGLS